MSHTHCTSCFKALGVPSRMEIYSFLSSKKIATVTDIVNHVHLTQPTISYHLNEMKKNGILISTKKGKEVHYSLSDICPHCAEKCVLSSVKFPNKKYA